MHEVRRYNALLSAARQTLVDLSGWLGGTNPGIGAASTGAPAATATAATASSLGHGGAVHESVGTSVSDLSAADAMLRSGLVPLPWRALSFLCDDWSLAPWLAKLQSRVEYLRKWQGASTPPPTLPLNTLIFPNGFLGAVLVDHARHHRHQAAKGAAGTTSASDANAGANVGADRMRFRFAPLPPTAKLNAPPELGVFVTGLRLQGARWDPNGSCLAEARPDSMSDDKNSVSSAMALPAIHFIPVAADSATDGAFADRLEDMEGVTTKALLRYTCPVYLIDPRTHATHGSRLLPNFVIAVDLPSAEPQDHWVLRGVAAICSP